MTVEEPQTTDAVSAASSPEDTAGPETETETTTAEVTAPAGAPVAGEAEAPPASEEADAPAESLADAGLVNDAEPVEAALPGEASPAADAPALDVSDQRRRRRERCGGGHFRDDGRGRGARTPR